ncbi:MAG TPA: prolipoprotein diacylglyceryl transferase [Sedimentisphaerales bacterium]|nr:prolipoprotein diacylglyceryl transferase [Sedimentisphaerales bacterium]HRS10964.1 prolipoprotein diacylglyceryl transferase [Sedimentisphaerales bacterium]HRV48658.1 prolipoprotein diacylglyceryl transferase [Sedimentisphaerales bacterium]
MHPELIEIPFVHLTVKSYGLMMVVGFLAAVTLIRYLSRSFTKDPRHITNAALYALVAGVIGARLFFVVHYIESFRDDPLSVFAIWKGGLELLGGVLLAIVVIFLYIRHHKLPLRHYLDALAVGLMLALVFGRIGCFLNGCCYGKPTDLPWAVRFPYGSFAYRSQVQPDLERGRIEPHLELPPEYFGYYDGDGNYDPGLKPKSQLTPEQREQVTHGPYRCLPVHPTQLYTSAAAGVLCLILYLFWRRSQKAERMGRYTFATKPGSVFGLMFVVYGIMRFLIEMVRDDNPFEIDHLTIAQLLGIGLVILGAALVVFFALSKPETLPPDNSKSAKRPK